MSDPQDVGKARAEDPDGTYCGKCGLMNYLADDIGWWAQDDKYVCHTCIDWSRINGER